MQQVEERLRVVERNKLSPLAHPPGDQGLWLIVNGLSLYSGGAKPAFTVSGKEITWAPAHAGYHLEATDTVVASYRH